MAELPYLVLAYGEQDQIRVSSHTWLLSPKARLSISNAHGLLLQLAIACLHQLLRHERDVWPTNHIHALVGHCCGVCADWTLLANKIGRAIKGASSLYSQRRNRCKQTSTRCISMQFKMSCKHLTCMSPTSI